MPARSPTTPSQVGPGRGAERRGWARQRGAWPPSRVHSRAMDTFTHGLFGLAVGALRRPEAAPGQRLSATDRAVLFARSSPPSCRTSTTCGRRATASCARCGPTAGSRTRSSCAAVGAAAAVLAALVVRWRLGGATRRPDPVYLPAWAAVVPAHLLPDPWTGWGTRLFLPFSTPGFALDWTMVLDPLVTLPLLVAAVVACAAVAGAGAARSSPGSR